MGLKPVKVLVVPLGVTLVFPVSRWPAVASPCSEVAFKEALDISRQTQARLVVSVAARKKETALATHMQLTNFFVPDS